MLSRQAPAAGEAYNFASGRPLSLACLGRESSPEGGRGGRGHYISPANCDRAIRCDGQPGHSSRARGYWATFDTSLAEGLQATVSWLRCIFRRGCERYVSNGDLPDDRLELGLDSRSLSRLCIIAGISYFHLRSIYERRLTGVLKKRSEGSLLIQNTTPRYDEGVQ